MIARVRGTNDICDLRNRNFFINKAKQHFLQNNFSEIITPILEHVELFTHSIGENSDIVSKEMYFIEQNDDEKRKVCLRPEVTASIIRACIQENIDRFPWKVFTHGPMFRYERPQKGRLRQFSQFNLEIIKTTSVLEDVNFIAMLNNFFEDSLNLENIILKINFLGCFEDRKKHKIILTNFLDQHVKELCKTCQIRKEKNPLRVFDCKNESCKQLYKNAPVCVNSLCNVCSEEWEKIQESLQILSVNYIADLSLVRGLDYYTKIVFEYSSIDLGAQNSFCGGGRYKLGQRIGAKQDFDCIGAGIGIERIELLLKNKNQSLEEKRLLNVIIPMNKEQDIIGIILSSNLQKKGFYTDIIFDKSSITNMMKKANKLGATNVIIIGELEQQENTVTLKNMNNGKKIVVKQSEAYKYL